MSRLAALMVVGLAVCGCVGAQEPGVDRSERIADLRALGEWVDGEQSFTPEARAQAHARIAGVVAGGPAGEEPSFYLQVASVVGLADNGHSNLTLTPVYGMGLVPVRTYWFSDGLHVVRARTDQARLLGARIDSIGGVAVDALVERLGRYAGGTDGYFRQYFSSPLMLAPAILHAEGVAASPDAAAYSVTLASGARERVTLSAAQEGPGRARPWLRLLTRPLDGESGGWTTVHRPGTEPPLALRDPDTTFRYVRLDDADAVYIQLRQNIDAGGVSIRDFAADARRRLEADRPGSIILDNRFNPGGDLTRTAELALDLPALVPDDGRVYVLTSNATFSAGIYTSFYPESTDPERTLVVGERVGDRERFWAESRGPVVLPNTGWRIGRSLQMHDLGEGCPIPDTCHLAGRGRMDIAVGSLDPEVGVPTTYADFRDGRDPVMEWVLAEIGR